MVRRRTELLTLHPEFQTLLHHLHPATLPPITQVQTAWETKILGLLTPLRRSCHATPQRRKSRGEAVSYQRFLVFLFYLRTREVINKREPLNSAIDTCGADIVSLTETWLHSNVHNHEIFSNQSSFHIYRCDRNVRQGSGVLLAIRKSIPSRVIHVKSELEAVWVCVEIGYRTFIFAVCYRPSSYPLSFVSELHDALNFVTTRHPNVSVFLLGYFHFFSVIFIPSLSLHRQFRGLLYLPSASQPPVNVLNF